MASRACRTRLRSPFRCSSTPQPARAALAHPCRPHVDLQPGALSPTGCRDRLANRPKPHDIPEGTQWQVGCVEHVPALHFGAAPLHNPPQPLPHTPTGRMLISSPALCNLLDVTMSWSIAEPHDSTGNLVASRVWGARSRSPCWYSSLHNPPKRPPHTPPAACRPPARRSVAL